MDRTDKIFYSCLALLGFVLLMAIVSSVYSELISDKITLTKNNWECTEYRMTPILTIVGKVPVTQYVNECQNYKRK